MSSSLECLTDWMTRQRWYAGKGRVPNLVEVTREEWPTDEPDARVIVLILRDLANNPPSLYHVPIVARRGLGPLGLALGAGWLAKKGYDKYQARERTRTA